MDETATISLDVKGLVTGKRYEGNFTVKTKLTRRDAFSADQIRRQIIGPNQNEAIPDLILESFYLAQIKVRVIEAPKWWKDSVDGLELEDPNVAEELYKLAKAEEDGRRDAVLKEAEAAAEKLAKKK
jgi:hypothetical protein